MTRRGPKIAIGGLAALGALVATQIIPTASADTILRATVAEKCQQNVPTACLWVDGRGGSGLAATITATNGKPDMLNNRMRGLTAQFTDNISVGYNGLPFDLCLYDTHGGVRNTQYPQEHWVADKVLAVPSGGHFAQLDDYNDVFDRYTTADPGSCPNNVEFDGNTGEIYTGRSPS